MKSFRYFFFLLLFTACDSNFDDTPTKNENKIRFVDIDSNAPIAGVEVRTYKCVEFLGIFCGSCSEEAVYFSGKSNSDGIVTFKEEPNHTRIEFLHTDYSDQFYEIEGSSTLTHKLRPQKKINVNLNGDSNNDSISSVSIKFCFYDEAESERCPQYYGNEYYNFTACNFTNFNHFSIKDDFSFVINGLAQHYMQAEVTYYKATETLPIVVSVVSSERQLINEAASSQTFEIDL